MDIEVCELGYEVGGQEILRDVSLRVNDKEFVGIIGPNGSGKSTFLKCLYRVLEPDCGNIYLDKVNLKKISLKDTALKMAVVAQHNFYNFDFKVLDVVLLGRSPHKKLMEGDTIEDYHIAYDALSQVGMEELATRSFASLSGGEQQRVILARALAQATDTLVVDEPTNHLDIKYQLQIMDIIKSHNCTTVAAIHDLNIAANYCDRIYAFKDGQVYGVGNPEELLTEELIGDLFGVKASIGKNVKTGQLNISYLSNFKKN